MKICSKVHIYRYKRDDLKHPIFEIYYMLSRRDSAYKTILSIIFILRNNSIVLILISLYIRQLNIRFTINFIS